VTGKQVAYVCAQIRTLVYSAAVLASSLTVPCHSKTLLCHQLLFTIARLLSY